MWMKANVSPHNFPPRHLPRPGRGQSKHLKVERAVNRQPSVRSRASYRRLGIPCDSFSSYLLEKNKTCNKQPNMKLCENLQAHRTLAFSDHVH